MTMHAIDLLSPIQAPLLGSASVGGGVSIDFDASVLIQFTAFLLLFFIIKPVLLDPFLRLMEERERRTDGAKAEARNMDEKAGEILKRYEGELEKVRKVANEERERLRGEAQRLEARILAETREETAKVAEEGKDKLALEAEAIRSDLSRVSADIAAQIAGRVLGREVQG